MCKKGNMRQEYTDIVKPVISDNTVRRFVKNEDREGSGRIHEVGGDACDVCPFCYGTKDWCPYLD
jgi:hypothetical protein